jgi:glycosyltransferase involved in cell wall biosynthesis
MDSNPTNYILADGRWSGPHGIGRFSNEVLSRLQQTDILTQGPKPLSAKSLWWQTYKLHQHKKNYRLFFTPGFNPIISSPMPFILTIHDLIHLYVPGKAKWAKRLYYEALVKPALQRAHTILTVSEYSKKNILEWTNLPESKIVVVNGGISNNLTVDGPSYQPGYPYLLHVGNTKPHKNIERLLVAYAQAKIDKGIRVILTGELTPTIAEIIKRYHLEQRIVFSGTISEEYLPSYYRGALGFVFPSLYEGFGLPPLEAMACGTPTLTSNITSLPEVVGDAAILVNPYEHESIVQGIEALVNNSLLREELITRGLKRVALYSWERTAMLVQKALNVAI